MDSFKPMALKRVATPDRSASLNITFQGPRKIDFDNDTLTALGKKFYEVEFSRVENRQTNPSQAS